MTDAGAPEPMDLENMRSLGVKSVEVICACGRESVVDVSAVAGDVAVPSLRLRMRCAGCGARPRHVRPNWLEVRAPGMGANAGL